MAAPFSVPPQQSDTTRLYSSHLERLSRVNQSDIVRLETAMQANCQLCNEFGIPHLHANEPDGSVSIPKKGKQPGVTQPNNLSSGPAPVNGRTVQYYATSQRAEPPCFLDGLKKDYVKRDYMVDDYSENMESWCYLCSTQEEHRLHMKTEKKIKGKPRVKYEAPPPKFTKKFVGVQERPGSALPPKDETLYKVTVKTGSSGTNANVCIELFDSRSKTDTIPLRKTKFSGFTFLPHAKESFHIRTSKLGGLAKLQVQHDGKETAHSWFLESIEVTPMTANPTVTVFKCNNWLSYFHGDKKVKRMLGGEEKPVSNKSYKVSVATGNLKKSGTDSRVFLTLIGSKGRSGKRELRKKTGHNKELCFSRGKVSHFDLDIEDIGHLKKIRVEHDGRGRSRRWHLLTILVEDLDLGKKYLFPCNQWLVEEEGNGKWREIPGEPTSALTELDELISSGVAGKENAYYECIFHTGSKTFAGTDANVYVELFGKRNRSTGLMKIPSSSSSFETGKIDTFQVPGLNVGDVVKMKVGHDNTGSGPGWYLDKVIVRKSREVIKEQIVEVSDDTDNDKDNRTIRREKHSSNEDEDEDEDEDTEENKDAGDEKSHFTSRHSLSRHSSAAEMDELMNSRRGSSASVARRPPSAASLTSASGLRTVKDAGDRRSSSRNSIKSREYLGSRNGRSYHDSDAHGGRRGDSLGALSSGDETSLWSGSGSEEEVEGANSESESAADVRIARKRYAATRRVQKAVEIVKVVVEEYTFAINRWLATDEADGLTECVVAVTSKRMINE